MLKKFISGLQDIAEALVSVKRIEKFMKIEELTNKAILLNNKNDTSKSTDDGVAIDLKGVSAHWDEGKTKVLDNINLMVKERSLTAVVGRVGSGKSSLLHAILREVASTSGELRVQGSVSYASQEPWIFTSSFKQNVLFGRPLDAKRYDKVIDVCQLRQDLDTFTHGDDTLLGEKGINLSGGQCARLNLARAIYRDADVYLLDDPLSSVDTLVGRRIFQECILNFLKNKTVVLVTHQLHFLQEVDRIVLLDEGRVQATAGSLQELNESYGVNLIQLTRTNAQFDDDEPAENSLSQRSETSKNFVTSVSPKNDQNHKVKPSLEEQKIEKKSRARSISLKTYVSYIKASKNVPLVLLVMVMSVSHQLAASGGDYFLAFWVNEEENATLQKKVDCNENSCPASATDYEWYIYFYSGLTIMHIILCLMQSWSFFEMSMKIANNLHANMFSSIISTTIDFFSVNPLGRIMNRYNK